MKRILTILSILISCSVSAQTGTADTIYIDVPAEVEALRMQTTECIAVGKKDKQRFGKKFLGYSFMQAWCYNGEKLDIKKHKEIFKPIKYYPYEKVVFNGFVLDKLDMDYSTEAGVIPSLIVGKYPVLIFRREADMRAKIDSLLCDIGLKDQEVRADWAKVATGNVTQEEAIEYALKMEATDSTNLAAVSRILDTYGWPSGLSDAANEAIFLVIDHSDLKIMNKYIGLFHDAVEKGYLSMNDLVTMEDRMLMNAGKPQKYGTQAYSLVEDGKKVIYIWPVEDPDKLDALRKSAGLMPIEDYLEIVKQQGVEIIYDNTKNVKDFKR
ncbi:MAG: hypothetical protein IJZ70_00020 [Bacteroidales bacterium]|nr:hypothetical protein [Bacteroidales bacterium]